MDKPIFYTERLVLRPVEVSDADDMFEYSKLNSVGPMAGWAPHKSIGETITIITQMINEAKVSPLGVYGIVLKENHKLIGTCELYNIYPDFKAELGYALSPKWWGQGYACEACEALLDYGFNHLSLKRIEAGCFKENIRSSRVLEKLSMTKEGLIKNGYLNFDGKVIDKLIYGITDYEYRNLHR